MTTAQSCARDPGPQASPKRFSPLAVLTAGLALCWVVLLWSSWQVYDAYRDSKTAARVDLKIQELRGTITHLDEVLTMSARMAAATGDLSWEDRYRRFEPALGTAIAEALQLAAGRYSTEAAARTDQANVKLVALENRTFKLIRQGHPEQARALVFSPEYERQKKIYAQGMVELGESLVQAAEANVLKTQRENILHAAVAAGLFPLTAIGYLLIFRATGKWSRAITESNRRLAEQAQALTDMNRDLDRTVAKRTLELAKTNEVLRRGKQEWERTFDSVPDLIAIIDDQHRIVRANRAMAKRLGVTPQQCVGRNCFQCVHGTDAPPASCPHQLTLADGREHTVEIHEERLGGDFLISTSPLLDERGQLIGSVHMARDITERKQAEAQIRSLARFPEENPHPVMRASLRGELLYTNPPAVALLESMGWRKGEPLPAFLGNALTQFLEEGSAKEVEWRSDSDQVYCFTIAWGAEKADFQLYGRDITARKAAEYALQKSRHFLQSVLDSLSSRVAILDEIGVIVSVNASWRAAAEVQGMHGSRHCVGMNYLTICQTAAEQGVVEARTALRGLRAVLIGEQERFEMEYASAEAQGQRGWFLMRVTRFNEEGHLRVVVAHMDISDHKRAAEAEAQQRSLTAAVSAMEQVLGVIGHELRTPLAGLRAMSELLLDPAAMVPAQAQQFLQSINAETVRMADMVNNMLEAARLRSGKARWNWDLVTLEQVCCDAASPITSLLDGQRVVLLWQVEPPGLSMRGDADALRRMILNLLSNAAKHTRDGRIQVMIGEVAGAQPRRIRIEVRDTGSGVSPEVADKLGRAFELNAGSIGADHVQGCGLGLAICRTIAAVHGGSIRFRSKLGRGSTFIITLQPDLPQPLIQTECAAITADPSETPEVQA